MPAYQFQDLVDCCNRSPADVVLVRQAEDDASSFFGLRPKKKVIEFIANGGLEMMQFINSKPWENNTIKVIPWLLTPTSSLQWQNWVT